MNGVTVEGRKERGLRNKGTNTKVRAITDTAAMSGDVITRLAKPGSLATV